MVVIAVIGVAKPNTDRGLKVYNIRNFIPALLVSDWEDFIAPVVPLEAERPVLCPKACRICERNQQVARISDAT